MNTLCFCEPPDAASGGQIRTDACTSVTAGAGNHGEAKTWRGLARAVRRLAKIRVYLTAAAVNRKRLAATFFEWWLLTRCHTGVFELMAVGLRASQFGLSG
jgi:hypothetical protein